MVNSFNHLIDCILFTLHWFLFVIHCNLFSVWRGKLFEEKHTDHRSNNGSMTYQTEARSLQQCSSVNKLDNYIWLCKTWRVCDIILEQMKSLSGLQTSVQSQKIPLTGLTNSHLCELGCLNRTKVQEYMSFSIVHIIVVKNVMGTTFHNRCLL